MSGTNDDIFMARYSAFNPYRIRQRDMGFRTPIGAGDALAKSIYCGMKPTFIWQSNDVSAPTGGIYNLEFSPDGSLLVAACQKRAIQIFDPLNHKQIHCMSGAHMDCVNGVKFLDSRMFATCSDDTTIALWDIRNLKKKICSLEGHSKWVKNIEFSKKDKLLVTSGLDGSIYTWDINSFVRCNVLFSRVFHTTSLMRCKLSPDSTQMILSTTGGLIILVHNLNLNTLTARLRGFKPNLYRLMQMSLQDIPVASKYDYLFDDSVKENRIEFITDFPGDNDAEVISSLQIHPHGWTALSRNISHDDRSEWTCVHDIQSYEGYEDKSTRDPSPQRPPWGDGRGTSRKKRQEGVTFPGPLRRSPRLNRPAPAEFAPRRRSTRLMGVLPDLNGDRPTTRADARNIADANRRAVEAIRAAIEANVRAAEELRRDDEAERREAARAEPVAGPSNRPSAGGAAQGLLNGRMQSDLWEANISIKQQRQQLLQDSQRQRGHGRRNFNMQRITAINSGISPPPADSSEGSPDNGNIVYVVRPNQSAAEITRVQMPDNAEVRPSLSGMTPDRVIMADSEAMAKKTKIRENRRRLLYYVEETNLGKGFIKELCYSSDGRIVCSPFGKGMRLLALDENCSEIPSVIQHFHEPKTMHEIGQSLGYHSDLVVCTRFNPRFHTLVTGCLEGKIVWYQPYSGELSH